MQPQLEKLAKRVNFPLSKIWTIDGSKRSSHSNAFFFGLWPFPVRCETLRVKREVFSSSRSQKHIVLYDTLLEKQTADEVEAVVRA